MSAVGAGPAAQGPLEGTLALGIGNLIGIAEAYPELKASENFAALQRDLASVEERISITRRVYNDTVETLNTAVAVFPSSLVAGSFGFRRRDFFTADAEVHTAPAVDLGGGATGEPVMSVVLRLLGALVITAVVAGALAIAPSVPTSEKEYEISDPQISVQLQEDGSLLVHESLPFHFTGHFSGAYRDIALNGLARVTDVTVSEDGEEYQPGRQHDPRLERPSGQVRHRERHRERPGIQAGRLALPPERWVPDVRHRLPGRQRRDHPQGRRRCRLDRVGRSVGLLAQRSERRHLLRLRGAAGGCLAAPPLARRGCERRRQRLDLGGQGPGGRSGRAASRLPAQRDHEHERRRCRPPGRPAGDREGGAGTRRRLRLLRQARELRHRQRARDLPGHRGAGAAGHGGALHSGSRGRHRGSQVPARAARGRSARRRVRDRRGGRLRRARRARDPHGSGRPRLLRGPRRRRRRPRPRDQAARGARRAAIRAPGLRGQRARLLRQADRGRLGGAGQDEGQGARALEHLAGPLGGHERLPEGRRGRTDHLGPGPARRQDRDRADRVRPARRPSPS